MSHCWLGPWWNESGIIHAKGPKWTPESHSCVHIGEAYGDFSWDVEANGNLMAAAPDLLEALQAVEWVQGPFSNARHCAWCLVVEPDHAPDCARQAALAKAEEA